MPADTTTATPQGAKSKKSKKNKSAAKAQPHEDNTNARTEYAIEGQPGRDSESPMPTHHNLPNGKSAIDQTAEPEPDLENTNSDAADHTETNQPSAGQDQKDVAHKSRPLSSESSTSAHLESEERFAALVRDRDSLRAEVIEMRKSLEEIQSKHREEMDVLQRKLEDSEGKKEHAENQFQKLLERVNTIKSQLGERLKEDAEELDQARSRIEELEYQNSNLKTELEAKASEIAALSEEAEQRSSELSSLRNRTNLSQQNWLKEKEELVEEHAYIRSEFEEAKQAMHNWEVLAMEERSIRENLGEKVIDLEEQLSGLKDAYEKATTERDSQAVTIDGLQKALQEIQSARKKELRELVESSDAQLEELRQALRDAEKRASEANAALQAAEKELERALPFEKEVKEKNLLIGKLRHEAVTLNDHLTKALRFLKRGKPEDNVDRHIVTNHLLHFLALDRSDPKKFQILQLIAALLGWTDEQREQAGLARPGTSSMGGRLRVPSTSVHRTPSTPTLATEFLDNGSASKESLAELWSNFLEQEVQSGSENTSRNSNQQGAAKSP
ncbi:hypothetical protein VTN00DRAFT_4545 [Thermoascus crustaceus]|uniref:uncharacterized protein n=1 Tax=Thermoascus crustaceus TaxID=5088 RepID=UPI003742B4D5